MHHTDVIEIELIRKARSAALQLHIAERQAFQLVSFPNQTSPALISSESQHPTTLKPIPEDDVGAFIDAINKLQKVSANLVEISQILAHAHSIKP